MSLPLTPGACPSPWGEPQAGGCLKQQPEDFIVDEVLGFEPMAEAGEHLWLLVRKRELNTDQVARELAATLGVRPDAVSCSGLKDRHALTTQWFSVHWLGQGDWPGGTDAITVETPSGAGWYQVLRSLRCARKLRKGTHAANDFVITLRDIQGDPEALEQRLMQLRDAGVPNYFGPQRFGHGGRNLAQGLALLADRRAGRRRRRDNRESLWLSSLRSALFNQVLAVRVEEGSWDRCLPGDVLQLDGRGSFFQPETGQEAGQDDWSARLQAGLIHPTGPLPGDGRPVISGEVAALEARVLAPWQDIVDDLAALRVPAQRRALRLRIDNLAWDWQAADVLRLAFRLTSGSFATSVVEQLIRLDAAPAASSTGDS